MKQLTAAEMKAGFRKVNLEASETGFKTLPDDLAYHFMIEWQYTQTKAEPVRPMVVGLFKVMSGDQKDKTHRNYSVIDFENTNGMKSLFILWRNLGVDTDRINSLDDVKEVCAELTKACMQAVMSLTSNAAGTNQYLKLIRLFEDSGKSDRPAKPAPSSASTKKDPEPVDTVPNLDEDEVIVGTRVHFKFKEVEYDGEIVDFIDEAKKSVGAESDKVHRLKIKADGGETVFTVKPENVMSVLPKGAEVDPNEE